jgi:hypothetical protein
MRLIALVCALIINLIMTGCVQQQDDIRECSGNQIKGWSKLLDEVSFETLTHRKQTNFDPFTESSEIAFADASYEYDRMITYTLSFPEGPSNRFGPKNACVSAVNFLTRQSIKGVPDDTLFAFLNFLQASGIPEKLSSDILTAYQESADFSLIGQSLALEFAAGSIEHVRGNFFVINVKTLNPFSNQALEEM